LNTTSTHNVKVGLVNPIALLTEPAFG